MVECDDGSESSSALPKLLLDLVNQVDECENQNDCNQEKEKTNDENSLSDEDKFDDEATGIKSKSIKKS